MKKALIVYGGWIGHDPEGIAQMFSEMLRAEGFEVTLSDTLDAYLEDLTVYDLLVPAWTCGTLPAGAEQNICNAVAAGVGIAGIHGGLCDAFREATTYQFVTGAQFVAHPGGGAATYTVNIRRAACNALVEGIEDFEVNSEQYYIHVDPAVNVLATTRFVLPLGEHMANGEVDVPIAYTKRYGKGKVYYNSIGHNRALIESLPQAKEMIRRGLIWAAR